MGRRRWGRHLAGAGLAFFFLLPLYWLLVASLRPLGLPPPDTIQWWPAPAAWDNYVTLFRLVPMARYLGNSLAVVAAAVPLTLFLASLAGFGLSLEPAPWRRRLLAASVALLLVPGITVWLFRFQVLRWLGLLDTLWALIAPAFAAGSPLFVLLYFWAFSRLPPALAEAARLEGAGVWTTWWRIGQPLVRPTTVAVSVLAFAMFWSDFAGPVLYIFDNQLYTLPVGLQIVKQLDATNWPLLTAAAVVMIAPVLLLFGGLQRAFGRDIGPAALVEPE